LKFTQNPNEGKNKTMAKYEYTEDMVTQMRDASANGVTEEIVQSLMSDFEFPRRSVTAKLRKEGFEVPKKEGAAPKFDEAETEELKTYLEANEGDFTADEIAAHFSGVWGREVGPRQINGKALSLELTSSVKPAEKKVVPKTYTEAEEATITKMVGDTAYLEEIADALGKSPNSVRGKLLSMQLKAPQRDKAATKKDAYEGIEEAAADNTVEELAAMFDKTPRGVKTVLTRRGISAKGYPPKTKDA